MKVLEENGEKVVVERCRSCKYFGEVFDERSKIQEDGSFFIYITWDCLKENKKIEEKYVYMNSVDFPVFCKLKNAVLLCD